MTNCMPIGEHEITISDIADGVNMTKQQLTALLHEY